MADYISKDACTLYVLVLCNLTNSPSRGKFNLSPCIWAGLIIYLQASERGRNDHMWLSMLKEAVKLLPGSFGMLVPGDARYHVRRPTTLEAPHFRSHVMVPWAQTSSQDHQCTIGGRGGAGGEVILDHLKQLTYQLNPIKWPQSLPPGSPAKILPEFLTYRIHKRILFWSTNLWGSYDAIVTGTQSHCGVYFISS